MTRSQSLDKEEAGLPDPREEEGMRRKDRGGSEADSQGTVKCGGGIHQDPPVEDF